MLDGNERTLAGEFYSNCTAYFEYLRKSGKNDYTFEDEFYFMVPAVSSQSR